MVTPPLEDCFRNDADTRARWVRWGFEHLNLTEQRLQELGMKGFTHPVKVSCEDHEANGPVLVQQWDGKKWNLVSEFIPPMREAVRPTAREDYFLARMTFRHLRPGDETSLISLERGDHLTAEVVVALQCSDGERYSLRGPVSPREAEGATAVHTIRQGSLVLKKGTLIGPVEVRALEAALPHATDQRDSADLALIGTAISRAQHDGIETVQAALATTNALPLRPWYSVAKPPGKQLQSISLLSGGEQTMTAVNASQSFFMMLVVLLRDSAAQAAGAPAQSVQWGAWAGGGMAVESDVEARMERLGVGVLSPEQGMAALGARFT